MKVRLFCGLHNDNIVHTKISASKYFSQNRMGEGLRWVCACVVEYSVSMSYKSRFETNDNRKFSTFSFKNLYLSSFYNS